MRMLFDMWIFELKHPCSQRKLHQGSSWLLQQKGSTSGNGSTADFFFVPSCWNSGFFLKDIWESGTNFWLPWLPVGWWRYIYIYTHRMVKCGCFGHRWWFQTIWHIFFHRFLRSKYFQVDSWKFNWLETTNLVLYAYQAYLLLSDAPRLFHTAWCLIEYTAYHPLDWYVYLHEWLIFMLD